MIHSDTLDLLAQALSGARDDDPAETPLARVLAHDVGLFVLPDVTADGLVSRVLVMHCASGQFLTGTVPGDDDPEGARRKVAAALLGKRQGSEDGQEAQATAGAVSGAADLPVDHEAAPAASPPAEDPAREKTPLEKMKAAYFARLTEHCGKFESDEFRRGVEGALIGALAPVPHPRNWEAGAYRSALEDLEEHAKTCEGGDACTLRTMAAERFFTPQEAKEQEQQNAPPFASPSTTTGSSATAAGVPGASSAAGEKKPTNGGGSSGTGLFCSSCARMITSGQKAVSMKAYAVPLCPACQKGYTPATAGASA